MINSQLISVVMPAYNAEKFIGESISSVIAQSYCDWELVITDDGSTDQTKDIIFSFQRSEPRIKYIRQPNSRQGKARNTGIENAKGELIAFIDADDIWKPGMLEQQINLLAKTGSDLVYSNITLIDKDANITEEGQLMPFEKLDGISGLKLLLKKNMLSMSTVLAKKNAIMRAGGFKVSDDLQYGEDYDLWLRMLLCGSRFSYNEASLVFYRKHDMQASQLVETRYFQVLDIIKNLPAGNSIQKEKDAVTYTWLRRSLHVSKDMGSEDFRKLIRFMPSFYLRKTSLYASYILPMNILRKFTYWLSFLHKT